MSQKQVLQQQLKQTLSPQQLLVVGLLECPILELENKIQQELEENPALEEGVDDSVLSDVTADDEQSSDEMDQNSDSPDAISLSDFSDYLSDDESDDFNYGVGNVAEPSDFAFVNYSTGQDFTEYLLEQIRLLNISELRM